VELGWVETHQDSDLARAAAVRDRMAAYVDAVEPNEDRPAFSQEVALPRLLIRDLDRDREIISVTGVGDRNMKVRPERLPV
jgi:hypothetical protein